MITWTLWTKRPASTRFSSPHLVLPKACLRVCTLTGASGSRCRLLRHRFFCTNFFWSISDGQKVFRLDLDPPLSDISPHQVLVFHGEDHLQRGTSLASAVAPVAPHQGKAVLPHGAAGARPCTGGASQGEGTESLLAASGCAGIKLFLISVDLGHKLLRITLVCLACELSLVAVKNNRRCKNDLFSSYTSWLLNSSAPPKKKYIWGPLQLVRRTCLGQSWDAWCYHWYFQEPDWLAPWHKLGMRKSCWFSADEGLGLNIVWPHSKLLVL